MWHSARHRCITCRPAADVLKAGSDEETAGWINEHLVKHGGTTSGLYVLTVSRETARRQARAPSWRRSAGLSKAVFHVLPTIACTDFITRPCLLSLLSRVCSSSHADFCMLSSHVCACTYQMISCPFCQRLMHNSPIMGDTRIEKFCSSQSVEVSRMASTLMTRAGSARTPSFRLEPPEEPGEEDAAPVEGVELGPLLGRGSYGRVYLGRWNGQEVAIKV